MLPLTYLPFSHIQRIHIVEIDVCHRSIMTCLQLPSLAVLTIEQADRSFCNTTVNTDFMKGWVRAALQSGDPNPQEIRFRYSNPGTRIVSVA
jgi:hypothetical protein